MTGGDADAPIPGPPGLMGNGELQVDSLMSIRGACVFGVGLLGLSVYML